MSSSDTRIEAEDAIAPWDGASPAAELPEPGFQPIRSLSLRSNFAWSLAGNVVYAGSQWFALITLAKLGAAEMVGRYALAMAIGFPISLIANLSLRAVFIADHEERYPVRQVLGLRFLLSIVSLAVMLAVCQFSHYSADITELTALIGTAQLLDCISETYWAVAQRYERNDRIAKSMMARSILSISGLAIGVIITHNLVIGAACLLVGRLLTLFIYDSSRSTFRVADVGSLLFKKSLPGVSLRERLWPKWDLRNQMHLLWTALPLGGVTILVAFNANVPRYVIERFMGTRELGIYSALNTIPLAGTMVASALGYAVFARLTKFFHAGNLRGFTSIVLKVMGICLGVGGIGVVITAFAGKQLLLVLYKPEFAERNDLLIYLMAVGAVSYAASCLGSAMTAASQFRIQLLLFAVVTATSYIASRLLVPHYGLFGAAYAALIAVIVQLYGSAAIIYRAMVARRKELAAAAAA